MQYVVTNPQMKEAERRCDQSGISYYQMMENAGTRCAEFLMDLLPENTRTVVMCGSGNNGGDGLVIARLLREHGRSVSVLLASGTPRTTDAAENLARLPIGTPVYSAEQYREAFRYAGCVVDCIYGTGFHGSLREKPVAILRTANHCAVRVAVDIPSGVNSDTGELDEHCFRPTHTLVIAAMKAGLLNAPASDILGEVRIMDIGIGEHCYEGNHVAFLTDESLRRPFPPHGRNTHKGTFGRLVGFAGSLCYNGAAYMCASSALRSGVGLYFAASPVSAVKIIAAGLHEAVYVPLPETPDGFVDVDSAVLEEIVLPKFDMASAVIVGCGLGNSENTRRLTEFVIRRAACPVIIDADGINSIAGNIDVLKERTGDTILTPHPLEFSRITGLSVAQIQSDRLNAAKRFAQEYGVTLLLKGADTVIAAPDGRVCVNARACSGLSKGGSGDVLTGIIGAFAAQGVEPFRAACAGAYCHWKAADILCARMPAESILPTDIIAALPEVYSQK
jgi:NAD(P)H-hydrate epimerase